MIYFDISTAPFTANSRNAYGTGLDSLQAALRLVEIRVDESENGDVGFDACRNVKINDDKVDLIDLGVGCVCRFVMYRLNGTNYVGHCPVYADSIDDCVFASPIDSVHNVRPETVAAIEKLARAFAWSYV